MYSIMLVMTDGTINDFQQAKNLIVQLSHFACSIFIVGIGNNIDWPTFDQHLKAEGRIKNSEGRQGMREILTFMPWD